MTNTVWIWFRMFGPSSPEAARFLLSASKRLDTHRLFRMVRDDRERLESFDRAGYEFRRTLYETLGTVEIEVVALRRVVVLAEDESTPELEHAASQDRGAKVPGCESAA